MDTCYTYSLLCNKSSFRDESHLFLTSGVHLYIQCVWSRNEDKTLHLYIYIVCIYIYCVPLHDRNEILPLYIYCVFSWTGKYYTYIYKHFSKKRESFQVLSQADIYFSAPNTFWILTCSSQAVFITIQFCYAILNCINLFF